MVIWIFLRLLRSLRLPHNDRGSFEPASQPEKKQILTRMDHFLALLENYQKQMKESKISLKENKAAPASAALFILNDTLEIALAA